LQLSLRQIGSKLENTRKNEEENNNILNNYNNKIKIEYNSNIPKIDNVNSFNEKSDYTNNNGVKSNNLIKK